MHNVPFFTGNYWKIMQIDGFLIFEYSILNLYGIERDDIQEEIRMKCYAVSTKDGENLILTKTQFNAFYATKPVGYQCLKCNSFEEAEIALRKIQNRKQAKAKNSVQKQANEYFAFYDSEFNCSDNKNTIQEIVSVGAVICDKEGKEVSSFYATVKPMKTTRLSKRCKDLTGLSQSQIDSSESLYWVSKRFCEWCQEYNITSIYTLGKNDALQLRRSIQLFNKHDYIIKMANLLTDIRQDLETIVDKTISSLSLANLKLICGLKEPVKHNALFDSMDLKSVYFMLMSGQYDKEAVKKIIDERAVRQKYNQARNVRDERISAPKEIIEAKNMLVEYLAANNSFIDKVVLHAIIDDLNDLFVSKY